MAHFQGKYLVNVKRKGPRVTRQVFLTKDTREALKHYLAIRGTHRGLQEARAAERVHEAH